MNRQPNRNTPPDPHDYDMYSAFHTKERGEAKKKSRYYDAYARRAEQEQNAGMYARRTQAQRSAAQNSAAQNSAPPPAAAPRRTAPNGTPPQNPNAQRQSRPANSAPLHTQNKRITYGQGLSNPNRPHTDAAPNRPTPPPAQPNPKKSSRGSTAQEWGTRVQNDGNDAYRFGYHSSYRTSDGRILDGFDAKGRPIYRDESASGSSAIAQRTEFAPETAENYKPARRIRIKTLADTDAKPFPIGILLTAVVCTAMIMVVLFAYMRLNEYTNTLSYLTYQLSGLRAQTNTLQAELVRREDLLSIEQTASEILGMVKTDVLTKKYITIENEDKTEVVAKLEEEARKRISVEIDLDTGKPIGKQNDGNAYIPPAAVTDEANTDEALSPETETVSAE